MARNSIFVPTSFRSGPCFTRWLLGVPAFQKQTPAETMAAILRDEPERVGFQNASSTCPVCLDCGALSCQGSEPSIRIDPGSGARPGRRARPARRCWPTYYVEPRPNNLPVPRTAFIGREHEAAALRQLLGRQDVRLVTLTGPGGIGKTRLALQVAGEIASGFQPVFASSLCRWLGSLA